MSLYQALRVEPGATQKDVATAFRRLAMELHPDRNVGREAQVAEEFDKVRMAYNILSNEASRNEYDSKHNLNLGRRIATVAVRGEKGTDLGTRAREQASSSASSDEDYEPTAPVGGETEAAPKQPVQRMFALARSSVETPWGLGVNKHLEVARSQGIAGMIPIGSVVVGVDGAATTSLREFVSQTAQKHEVVIVVKLP